MEQNDWLTQVRNAVKHHEVAPPESCWQRIAADAGIPVVLPLWRRAGVRRALAAAAVVLMFVSGYGLWEYSHNVSEEMLDIPSLSPVLAQGGSVEENPSGKLARVVETEDRPAREARPHHRVKPAVTEPAVAESVAENPVESESRPAEHPQKKEKAETKSADTGKKRENYGDEALGEEERRRYEALFAERPVSRRSENSVSVFAGGVLSSGSGTKVAGLPMRTFSSLMANETVSMSEPQYDEYTFSHHQPLSFGLTVQHGFKYGLSLETGLIYTLLRSEAHSPRYAKSVSQQMHFVGLPVRLNWQFWERGGFSAYLGTGAMVERCVHASLGGVSIRENSWQWSVSGMVGVQYAFGSVVGLYFEPDVSYYFTETRLASQRNKNPLTFSLRLGLRFRL